LTFLEDISQSIADNTSNIIGYPISITDNKGYIIGSTDLSRLGTFHKASIEVLDRKETICYEPEDVKDFHNVLPGVAAPIIINNEPIGVLGIVGSSAEVKKYAQVVKSHVELMCHEYLKKEMSVLESKTLNNLIHYLLNYVDSEDADYIVRYGKMLGFNLDLKFNRVCLLIEINTTDQSHSIQDEPLPDKFSWQILQNNLVNTLSYYLTDNKEDLLSSLTLDQFILIKTLNEDEPYHLFVKKMEHKIKRMIHYLKIKYNYTATISIGSVNQGIAGIKESYHDSLKALKGGKKTSISPRIYYYNDWNIILELLGDGLNPCLAEKITDKIQDFIHHVNFQTLASTFISYCKCNMNISEAARKLFLHRNSLVYRLEKIKELTSLDYANFEHCLILYFAIKNLGIDERTAIDTNIEETEGGILP